MAVTPGPADRVDPRLTTGRTVRTFALDPPSRSPALTAIRELLADERPHERLRSRVRLTPLELLDRLATRPPFGGCPPPPRVHRHRYHGVLAPNAALRPLATPTLPTGRGSAPSGPRGSVGWARLLARIHDATPRTGPAATKI